MCFLTSKIVLLFWRRRTTPVSGTSMWNGAVRTEGAAVGACCCRWGYLIMRCLSRLTPAPSKVHSGTGGVCNITWAEPSSLSSARGWKLQREKQQSARVCATKWGGRDRLSFSAQLSLAKKHRQDRAWPLSAVSFFLFLVRERDIEEETEGRREEKREKVQKNVMQGSQATSSTTFPFISLFRNSSLHQTGPKTTFIHVAGDSFAIQNVQFHPFVLRSNPTCHSHLPAFAVEGRSVM